MSSRVEQFAHLVWSTRERRAWLTAEVETLLHRVIQAKSLEEQCKVIAIGGLADHVHVLARVHPSVSLARLAGVLKATSSGAMRRSLMPGSAFAWQTGYGAFSVSPRHVGAVERYVAQQKYHHLQRQPDRRGLGARARGVAPCPAERLNGPLRRGRRPVARSPKGASVILAPAFAGAPESEYEWCCRPYFERCRSTILQTGPSTTRSHQRRTTRRVEQ